MNRTAYDTAHNVAFLLIIFAFVTFSLLAIL